MNDGHHSGAHWVLRILRKRSKTQRLRDQATRFLNRDDRARCGVGGRRVSLAIPEEKEQEIQAIEHLGMSFMIRGPAGIGF